MNCTSIPLPSRGGPRCAGADQVCCRRRFQADTRRASSRTGGSGQHPDHGTGDSARTHHRRSGQCNRSLSDDRRGCQACGTGIRQGSEQAHLLRRVTGGI